MASPHLPQDLPYDLLPLFLLLTRGGCEISASPCNVRISHGRQLRFSGTEPEPQERVEQTS